MEDKILSVLLDMQKNMKSIDGRLDRLNQDVSGLKGDVSSLKSGQESLKQDVSGLKAGQESLQEQVTKTNITLENNIDKKLSALFDGHQLNTEKIDHIIETVDDIDSSVTAMDVVTQTNVKEIKKLKTKIG